MFTEPSLRQLPLEFVDLLLRFGDGYFGQLRLIARFRWTFLSLSGNGLRFRCRQIDAIIFADTGENPIAMDLPVADREFLRMGFSLSNLPAVAKRLEIVSNLGAAGATGRDLDREFMNEPFAMLLLAIRGGLPCRCR